MAMISSQLKKPLSYKALIGVSLTAAMLTLGACSKKEDAPIETETTETTVVAPVAEPDTAVAVDDNPDMAGDDMGAHDEADMATHEGMPMDGDMNDVNAADSAVASDDVGVATADDSEMMDGTDKNEHISTN